MRFVIFVFLPTGRYFVGLFIFLSTCCAHGGFSLCFRLYPWAFPPGLLACLRRESTGGELIVDNLSISPLVLLIIL
jgi:hypothetical protein